MARLKHEPSDNAFYLRIEEETACLWYSRKKGCLSLDRIFVPPDHRGKGWADKLTRKVLQYCRRNNLSPIAGCGYVRDRFLPENPEFKERFVDRDPPPGAEFLSQ